MHVEEGSSTSISRTGGGEGRIREGGHSVQKSGVCGSS